MTTETFWTGVLCFVIGEFVGMGAILFFMGAFRKPDPIDLEFEETDNVVPFRRVE